MSSINTLILIALAEEAPKHLRHRHDVFFTGVGKVNAAMIAAQVIATHQPKRIINFGTAGGITVGPGLHHCTRFVQRDMDCRGLGFTLGHTPFDDHADIGVPGMTCSSGDNFVSNPALEIPADVVDMEAYALAKVCVKRQVEFMCFKYVTDAANAQAHVDWREAVAQGESMYVAKLQELGLI